MANHKLNLMVGMNPSQAVSGFKAIGASAATSMADAALGVDRLSARVQAMGLSMVAASAVGMKGLYSLAETGSALSEQQSRVNQIFGKSDAIIKKFAATADKSFGLSERAVNEATATFGTFFKAAGKSRDEAADMSVTMTKLASDFASFADTTPEEAITAIGAAFRGEMEPIRRYGILLDDATLRQEALKMGLVSTVSEALTPAQKTLAAYNLILAQSTDMQGNFALTSGGLANQQRMLAAQMENLRATIGQALEPAFSSALKIVNHFVEILNKIPKPVISIAANAALLGTALTGVAGVMTVWLGRMLSTNIALKGMDKLAGVLPGRLGKVASSMEVAGKAAAAFRKATIALVAMQIGIDVWNDVTNASEKASKAQTDFILATQRGKDNLVDYFNSLVRTSNETARFSNIVRNLGDKFTITGDLVDQFNVEDFEDVIASLVDQNPELLIPLIDQLKAEQAEIEKGTFLWEQREQIISMLESAYSDNKEAVDAAAIAAGTMTTEEQKLADALEEAKDALETHTKAAGALADEYDRILDTWLGLNGQSLNLQQSYLDLNQAIWDYVSIQNGSQESDKSAEQNQIDVQKALDETATAYVDTAVAMREANGETVTAKEKTQLYKEALLDLKDKFPELQGVIDPLIQTMDGIPDTIETTVEVDGVAMSSQDVATYVRNLDGISEEKRTEILTAINRGEYAKVERELKALEDPIQLNIRTENAVRAIQAAARNLTSLFGWGTGGGTTPPPAQAKAIGGTAFQGQAYRVGEQGPEIFVPDTNGTIVSAGAKLTPAQAKALFPNFVPLGASSTSSSSAGVTGDSEADIMANKFEAGAISADDYRAYLQKRMGAETQYSNAWMQTWRTLKQLSDQAAADRKRQDEEEIADDFRKNEIMYLTGEKSAADYKAFLESKIGSYQKYSEDWFKIWGDLKRLQDEQDQAAKDATKAQEDQAQAAKEEAEAAVKAAYDKAEALADLTRANDELLEAVAEADRLGGIAYMYSLDKRRSADERAQAAADADRAYQRAAEALFGQAKAQASTKYAEGTVDWAREVNTILNGGKGGYNGQIQGYLSKLQQSVPQLASGGVVKARPGGTLINVGEGGQDEWVIPASRMGHHDTTIIYMNVIGNNPTEVAKALETHIAQTGRKPRGL